jgi:uncharacterized Fe-S cluster-containing radical SAM superfamily protein
MMDKIEPKSAGFDPLEEARLAARVVCRGDRRKYYRFRAAKFYGGIATADCLGCCLRCLFCWSWPKVIAPGQYGKFYSPAQVASKLTHIALKKGFHQLRISGNEPTIARDHLLKVLELIPKNLLFILETNGILIGADESYARDLARFNNLYVRVSLKAFNQTEFSAVTGAIPEGFQLQLQALESLARFGVKVHPALMISLSSPEAIDAMKKRLGKIRRDFSEFEIEELVVYGDLEDRLIKANLLH